MCTSTKFHKFMHDIVTYIQHHAMILLNSQHCVWNWWNWVLVHMNLPNSTNSMYDVVKWYFDYFTPPYQRVL
jgi:hypothetical protein